MSLYDWTGNPFVDAGISAILEWSNRNSPANILKSPADIQKTDLENIAKAVLDIFTQEKWVKNMYSIFPNGALTHNHYAKNAKKSLDDVLQTLLDGVEPLQNSGNCIACGRRDSKRLAPNDPRKLPNNLVMGKTYLPLTGSGTFLNTFSYAEEGNDLCFSCAFAVQCFPLVLYACGNLALVHSNNHKVLQYWATSCIKKVNEQIALQNYTGCFNENFVNPLNALFHIAHHLLTQYYEKNWEHTTIRIYHFTNYNQGPDLALYDLPATIFTFLHNVIAKRYVKIWDQIVQRGYHSIRKGQVIPVSGKTYEEYKNYKNKIYQDLIQGQSILGYFYNVAKRKVYGNWDLLTIYLKEILKMKDERMTTIKELADAMADIIQHSPNGEKRLQRIEFAKNYNEFRSALFRFIRDNIALKNNKPLFTFEQYTEQLFPPNMFTWKETHDLILFRLYEVLHPWLISQGIIEKEDEEEEQEEQKEQEQQKEQQ